MAYRTLKTAFHMSKDGGKDASHLYEQRITSEATLRWEFPIGEYPAFCMLTPALVQLSERILRTEQTVFHLWRSIPGQAAYGYLLGLLVHEIEATNEIESVHSTRKEISDALTTKLGTDKRNKRFVELARMYKGLSNEEISPPRTLEEIRSIFDAITDGELAEDDRIEGSLFRAHGTSVTNGVKTIHQGVSAEQISERLETMLAIAHDEELPVLVAAMVSHFMFEYIHPFYDGNGRTGRFLLSQMLMRAVSIPTALTLSPVINRRRADYYKAFVDAEQPLNRGDLTPFVQQMLEFLVEAQADLLRDLEARYLLFQDLSERVEKRRTGNKAQRRQAEILYVLGQAWLFSEGSERTLTLEDLGEYFEEAPQTLRRDLKQLEGQEMIGVHGFKPLRYGLSAKACAELGLETQSKQRVDW